MAFDTWENVGYRVIDKIDSYDNILRDIREDLLIIKSAQSTLATKMWAIGIVATIAASVISVMYQ